MKKIPWFSLGLLLLTYATVGWVASAIELARGMCTLSMGEWRFFDWVAFVAGSALALLLAEILAAPFSNVRKGLVYSFSTDTRAFILVISLAFFAAVLVIWVHVVAHALVAISSGILARLDLLSAGINNWRAFWILSTFSLSGFTLGWVAHTLVLANQL